MNQELTKIREAAQELGHSFHELKAWPKPFSAMWSGNKRFTLRKDDRGYNEDIRYSITC
jgi:hypothetical protein